MTGTISRLLDGKQIGTISGEDGVEYVFTDSALRGVSFGQLSLGTAVTFSPARTTTPPRAEAVRLVR